MNPRRSAHRVPVFEAHITSPRGSLYFAAEATMGDFDLLRSHVDELRSARGRHVLVELSVVAPDETIDARLRDFAVELATRGVEVRLWPGPHTGASSVA
jgi:hypothetical protein